MTNKSAVTNKAKWQCLRSGHCCSVVGTVTMTHQERALLESRVGAGLTWAPHEDARFTRLVGHPACPLLTHDAQGHAECTVHDIRPYNCRRWGCFRTRPDEPFDVATVNSRIYHDRAIRRQASLLQRRAQKWALDHGWEPDSPDAA